MGFFQGLIEKREFSLARFSGWMDSGFGGEATASGIAVSDDTAEKLAIVKACVTNLAQDVAKVPLPTFRRLGNYGSKGREAARDFPTWNVFQVAANPYMTAYKFRETMQRWLNITGNAYALIEMLPGGGFYLWPRDPHFMEPKVIDGQLAYVYTMPSGKTQTYLWNQVFHLKLISKDGIVGMSPVEMYREGIGLGQAYQAHAAFNFKNQVRPSLYAKTSVSPDQAKEIGKALVEAYAGLQKTGGVLVGYGGLEFSPWGFSAVDAEYIKSTLLQIQDTCRIWRMPPHKVMEYSQAAYANMTAADLAYVNDTLSPHQENWEQEIALQLMTEAEREIFYCEHDNSDFLKGTPTERATVEAMRTRSGHLSIDEVRLDNNRQPIEGGDECMVQGQMIPVSQLAKRAMQPQQQQPRQPNQQQQQQPGNQE